MIQVKGSCCEPASVGRHRYRTCTWKNRSGNTHTHRHTYYYWHTNTYSCTYTRTHTHTHTHTLTGIQTSTHTHTRTHTHTHTHASQSGDRIKRVINYTHYFLSLVLVISYCWMNLSRCTFDGVYVPCIYSRVRVTVDDTGLGVVVFVPYLSSTISSFLPCL